MAVKEKSEAKEVKAKGEVKEKAPAKAKAAPKAAAKAKTESKAKTPAAKAAPAREKVSGAGKEKIRIRIKGYDHNLVDQSAERILQTVRRTGGQVSGPVPLPTKKEIITILRSTHVNKDSREQFEMRTHKRLIDVLKPTNKTVDSLTSLELPAGVEIEIKL